MLGGRISGGVALDRWWFGVRGAMSWCLGVCNLVFIDWIF